MECPNCKISWNDESSQYCPKCGKLSGIDAQTQFISNEQKFWVIVSGFLCYFLLFYLIDYLHIINLPFSNTFYLGLAASLFMFYRLSWFWAHSNNYSLKDFFPHYIEFLIIVGIGIYLSAIVLEIIVYTKTITFGFLGIFTSYYFLGFISGLVIQAYHLYRTRVIDKGIVVRNHIILDRSVKNP